MITAPIVKRTMITGDAAAATVSQSVRMPEPGRDEHLVAEQAVGRGRVHAGLHEEGPHVLLAHREARVPRARPDRCGELGE